jgi:hypothetical protein
METHGSYLTGSFRDANSAERAYNRLREKGYTAGLAGAGAGGVTGGIVGALVGSGIPKDRAERYERGIKQGDIVMGVRPRTEEEAKFLEQDWRQYEAQDIYR